MNAVEMVTEKYINEEAKKLQEGILNNIDKALDNIHSARRSNAMIYLGEITEQEAINMYNKLTGYKRGMYDFDNFKKFDLVPVFEVLEKLGIYYKH